MGLISWITKSGLKLTAVVAAIKISVDQNVWTLEPAVGESVYQIFTKDIVNGAVVYKENLPSCEAVKSDVGAKWNQNVNCAFRFMNQFPDFLKDKTVAFYKTTLDKN